MLHVARNNATYFEWLHRNSDLGSVLDAVRANDAIEKVLLIFYFLLMCSNCNGAVESVPNHHQAIGVKFEGETRRALPHNASVELVERMLGMGYGMVIRFEDLRASPYAPFAAFESDFVDALGFQVIFMRSLSFFF